MKKFRFVFKKETKKVAIQMCVIMLIGIAVALICADWRFILRFAFFAFLLFCFEFNVISQYRITENGVENRLIRIKWEEIRECEVFYPERLTRNFFKKEYPPVICIGDLKEGSFFVQNKTKCVFVPLTEYNLELLSRHCKDRNTKISNFLKEHYDK